MRPCSPGEVVIGTVGWTGATAEMAGGFTLVNVGTQPCTVGGRPGVQLLDATGAPLPLAVEPFESGIDPGSVLLLPNEPTPADEGLIPGTAGAQLFWTNWCGPAWSSGTLVVSLAGVGELRAPMVGLSTPRCDAPRAPSTLLVGPIITPR